MAFLVLSSLDLIGVGLVGVFVGSLNSSNASGVIQFARTIAPEGMSKDVLTAAVGLLLAIFFVIKNAATWLLNKKILGFGAELLTDLRGRAMDYYQNQEYLEFSKQGLPYFTRNILSYTNQFSGTITLWLSLISELTVAVLLLALLFISEWQFTLTLTCLGIIFVSAYNFLIRGRLEGLAKIQNETTRKVIRSVNEGLRAFKELKVSRKASVFQKQIRHQTQVYGRTHISINLWMLAPRLFLEVILVSFVILIILTTISMGKPIAEIYPFLAMVAVTAMRLVPSLTLVTSGIVKLRKQRPAVETLATELQRSQSRPLPDVSQQAVGKKETSTTFDFGFLEFNDVSYQFPGVAQPILDKVSLEIRRGQIVGIGGHSGTGKTTVLDLAAGIIVPTSGAVTLQGSGMSRSPRVVKDIFSYVTQLPVLFDTSIADNVRFGEPGDDDVLSEKLRTVLEVVQLWTEIACLPNGINSDVGDDAIKLSGGQRQRLAIARSLMTNCELLLLDEATSAVDEKMAVQILDNIREHFPEKTLLIVSHSVNVLEKCDEFYWKTNDNLEFVG